MKRFAKFAVVLLGLSPLVPCSVAGATTDNTVITNLRGPLINASFSAPDPADPSGCTYLEATVTAESPVEQNPPGPGVPGGTAGVIIDRMSYCTDTVLSQAWGFTDALPAGALWVPRRLDSAALKMTIGVSDIDTGRPFDVTVDIRFTGTSDITRDHDNTNVLYYPKCRIIHRWHGSGRDATASGTISDGVTNFLPAPSQSAEIGWVVSGYEFIDCV